MADTMQTVGQLSQLERALDRVQRGWSRFNAEMQRSDGVMHRVYQTGNMASDGLMKLSNISLGLVIDQATALAGKMKEIGQEALNVSADTEVMAVTLRKVYQAEGPAIYKQLNQIAEGSLHDKSDILKALKTLHASGMGDDKSVKMVGDWAAAKGKTMSEVADVFKMINGGDYARAVQFAIDNGIRRDDLINTEKLEFGGVNNADYRGKAGADKTEALKTAIINQIGEKYIGTMDEQASSYRGIWGTIGLQVEKLYLKAMGFDENTLSFRSDSLFMKIKEASLAVQEAMSSVLSLGALQDDSLSIWEKTGAVLSELNTKLWEWYTKSGKKTIEDIAFNLGEGFGKLLMSVFGMSLDSDQNLFISAGKTIATGLYNGFKESFDLSGLIDTSMGQLTATLGGAWLGGKLFGPGGALIGAGLVGGGATLFNGKNDGWGDVVAAGGLATAAFMGLKGGKNLLGGGLIGSLKDKFFKKKEVDSGKLMVGKMDKVISRLDKIIQCVCARCDCDNVKNRNGSRNGGGNRSQARGATRALPSAATRALPSAVTRALPSAVTRALPAGATRALPAGATRALPAGATRALPAGATRALPAGATGALPAGATRALPAGATRALPAGATGALPAGATRALPAGVTGALPAGVTGALPAGATRALPAGATRALPAEATQALPAGATRALPAGAMRALTGGAALALPGSVMLDAPDRAPRLMPNGATQVLPGAGADRAGSGRQSSINRPQGPGRWVPTGQAGVDVWEPETSARSATARSGATRGGGMKGAFGKVARKIPFLGALLGGLAVAESSDPLATGAQVAGSLAGGFAGGQAGAALGAAIGSIVPGAGTAIGAVVGGGIGSIAGAIGGEEAVVWIQTHMDSIKGVLFDGWEGIKNFFGGIGNWFGGLFDTIGTAVTDGFSAVTNFFTQIPTFFSDTWDRVIEGVTSFGSNLWNGLTGWVDRAISSLVEIFLDIPYYVGYGIGQAAKFITETLPQMWMQFQTWIGQLPANIWNWMQGVWTNFSTWLTQTAVDVAVWAVNIWNQFTTWVGQLPAAIWNWMQALWTNMTTWLGQLWTDAGIWLSNLATSFSTWFETAVTNAVQWVQELPGRIASFIQSIPERVEAFIAGVGETFLKLGATIIDSIASGITSALQKVTGVVSWAIEKASAGFDFVVSSVSKGYSDGKSGKSATTGGVAKQYHGGGLVDEEGWAILKRKEMVLDENLSSFIRTSASQATGTAPAGAGTEVNVQIGALANTLNVREEADIQQIASSLSAELRRVLSNQGAYRLGEVAR
ncbi:hypothetical protein CIG75_03130 [Tumebacillus algifaecis]|uniref:Phage tail tape measure protein domain-containing protein n=1 Tax=Tumebacillus algifaecis TaxID=1214604 RepID=A0A223CXW8_9BACL|nr:hypothetical protein [Tumebacillus algifaecis]ASS74075.1 hypothetical protein CIG75_03130 [Tumebacillus algifaecis]